MNETNTFKLDSTGYLSQDDTKRYYSRIGLFCFILGTVSFLTSIAASVIIGAFFGWLTKDSLTLSILNYAISFIAIYCIATPLAMLSIKPLPRIRPIKEKLRAPHFIAFFCISFTFMQVGSYFSNILIMITETLSNKTLTNPVEQQLSTGNLLLSAVFVGILFPILEELLFRKLLCNRLLPLGEKYAIIISAAIFGFIHGNLYQFAYAFLVGLLFGYVYVKTGKLIYSIILHCAVNLYSGVFASYVISKVPIEKLSEIFLSEDALTSTDALLEQLSPYAAELTLYMIYSYLLMGLSIAGFIILFIAVRKQKITLELGILPPAREHRIANFFLTGGVAAAIAFIAIKFIYSIAF